jgi:hypothetical protein
LFRWLYPLFLQNHSSLIRQSDTTESTGTHWVAIKYSHFGQHF